MNPDSYQSEEKTTNLYCSSQSAININNYQPEAKQVDLVIRPEKKKFVLVLRPENLYCSIQSASNINKFAFCLTKRVVTSFKVLTK